MILISPVQHTIGEIVHGASDRSGKYHRDQPVHILREATHEEFVMFQRKDGLTEKEIAANLIEFVTRYSERFYYEVSID